MTGVPNCSAFPFNQSHAQATLFKQICGCCSGNAGTDDQDVDRNVPIQRWERFNFGRIQPVRFLLHHRLSRPSFRLAFDENLLQPAAACADRAEDLLLQSSRRLHESTDVFHNIETDVGNFSARSQRRIDRRCNATGILRSVRHRNLRAEFCNEGIQQGFFFAPDLSCAPDCPAYITAKLFFDIRQDAVTDPVSRGREERWSRPHEIAVRVRGRMHQSAFARLQAVA